MYKLIFLGICGMCFGVLTSAGVFTVLSTVSLVPRFIGKTHSAKSICLYENMIIFGTTLGGMYSVFADNLDIGDFAVNTLQISETVWKYGAGVLLGMIGLFSGIMVGCLALAIAEMLDSIPIFTRRISFRHGLGIVILSMAAAKLWGSLFYFYHITAG